MCGWHEGLDCGLVGEAAWFDWHGGTGGVVLNYLVVSRVLSMAFGVDMLHRLAGIPTSFK